ncbi:MAG: DNA repair protein RecN [Clostridia bacterium]|nr:DNA repair protein RecN [Clostridia bacterium]
MIKSLHIENIAVIEKTDIDFDIGFNVLTGETGAGKSIIIDAINAVLGERTSKDLIRAGCEKAVVSALFCDLSNEAKNLIIENGFELDDDGNLLVLRTLTLSGGTIKINGRPATASILKELSKNLINIHGQHDNQRLLNPDNYYCYLDLLAENQKELTEYYNEFKHFNDVRRELNSQETDEGEKQRRIDILQYQIKELEDADIAVGEIDEIRRKLTIAENYEKTLTALSDASFCIDGSENADGAMTLAKNAQKYIESAKNEELSSISNKLDDIIGKLYEISADIRSFTESEEYRDLDAEKLRERLDTLRRLMLKYGDDEQKMIEFLAKAKAELEKIECSDKRIEELSLELDASTERLVSLGEKLTETRKKAAQKFSQQVSEVLRLLDMPNVQFIINVNRDRYTRHGCDAVEFLISANAGESVKPLHKIASGGELSRTMLAIKSVLADKDDVDTLIFDEIDTGISGRAADKVGLQLQKVADSRQVICVTHLAQIAAYAQNHLLIEKSVSNDRTYTSVTSLDNESQIREIARIMSGTEITENLYNSAKELLDRSKK